MENFEVIEENYSSKNNFCLLKLKGILKIIMQNDYAISPLVPVFKNYIVKLKVQEDLDCIRKSEYKNFSYMPFNKKIKDILEYKEL